LHTVGNGYSGETNILENVVNLLFAPSFLKRQFSLEKIGPVSSELIYLRENLKVSLRPDVIRQSLTRLRSQNRKFTYAKAALLLGTASACLAALVSFGLITSAVGQHVPFDLQWLKIPLLLYQKTYANRSTLMAKISLKKKE